MVEDEYDGVYVLDVVVMIGEVVYGFELFVDDVDVGFVCFVGDFFDIGGRFVYGF